MPGFQPTGFDPYTAGHKARMEDRSIDDLKGLRGLGRRIDDEAVELFRIGWNDADEHHREQVEAERKRKIGRKVAGI